MDHIKNLVDSFSAEEKKEFGHFVNRMRKRKGRKDLELFELLAGPKELKAEVLMHKLYGKTSSKTAYHALRKRLRRHLMDYVFIRNLEIDETGGAEASQLLGLATHLFHRKSDDSAWFYLKKAESLGQKSEDYAILTQIYLKMLEQAPYHVGADYPEILRAYQESRIHRREDEQAELALAKIGYHLNAQQMHGVETDLDTMVKEVIAEFELSDKYRKRPKLFFTVMSLVRSSYLGRNEIGAFPNFLKSEFERFEWEKGFSQQNAYFRSQLLYMLSHVFYRAWEFDTCAEYLQQLEESLENAARRYLKILQPKALMLRTAVQLYQGQAEQAVELLKPALKKTDFYTEQQRLNMRMQLSLCLFCLERYEEVLDIYLAINHSDHFLAKKMGREWLFKKFLIEIITHFELGNEDLVLNRMRSIERQFSDLKDVAAFGRALKYMYFLKKYFKDPEWLTPESLANEIDTALQVEEQALEDSQVVTYYSYLRAKAYDVPFYALLINVFSKGEHF